MELPHVAHRLNFPVQQSPVMHPVLEIEVTYITLNNCFRFEVKLLALFIRFRTSTRLYLHSRHNVSPIYLCHLFSV